MINRTLAEIAAMLRIPASENIPTVRIKGVSKDSRTIQPGQLYIPLIGENFDGHEFVADAFARGAAASLWQKDHQHPPSGVPLIYVDDVLLALQQLAHVYRKQLSARIIGITGSNGKTTTKDLVASVLETAYKTQKTQGNLNNHIGLPLTLLSLEEDTEIAVLEMGMSGRGEIDLLSRLAEPDAVIITMIGDAHLLQLGSREGIARAKMEILSGLRTDGWFIYDGDEPLIQHVLSEIKLSESVKSIRFGQKKYNDYYTGHIRFGEEGTFFTCNDRPDPWYYIPLLGRHNVKNALTAIAVAEALGVPEEKIVEGLSTAQMSGMRVEKLVAPGGYTILNDAYNASPASMSAALELLHELHGYKRKLVVLGDMLELGDQEQEYHREIGRKLNPAQIYEVYATGPLGRLYAEEASKRFSADRVHWHEHNADLAVLLTARVQPGDVVLVKGSRGMKLEQIVQALMNS